MRRNGMLSYRPDLAAGGLVKSETQAWCKGMKEGSHRLKDHWLFPRYKWLEISVQFPSGGRPKPADWRSMKHARRLQDMEEFEYCAAEDERILLKSLPDEIFEANPGADLGWWTMEDADWGDTLKDDQYLEHMAMVEAMELQITPAKRRLMQEVDELMTTQGPQKELKEMMKNPQRRKRARAATDALVKKHERAFQGKLKGASVMEAIEAIPLKVGPKARAKKEERRKQKKAGGHEGVIVCRSVFSINPPPVIIPHPPPWTLP